ncbi:MAG: L,D-transpeptidase [Patescibacteria group bacterium]
MSNYWKAVLVLFMAALLLTIIVGKCRPDEIKASSCTEETNQTIVDQVIVQEEDSTQNQIQVEENSLEVKRQKLRQLLLNSPNTLKLIHDNGLQIHDFIDPKWKVSPLDEERLIRIDRENQCVIAFKDGLPRYIFKCSTRADCYGKDVFGIFTITSMEENHWSKKYCVWMPHALHFYGDIFIHASNVIDLLGHKASHGCIRLHPKTAKVLYHNHARIGEKVEFR